MGKYKNILLVEDSEDDQELFRKMIEEIDPGISLAMAWNGRDALSYLLKQTTLPDLMFVDINMPMMNGMELLSVLKEDEAYSAFKNIPVVTLTTSITEPEKCYELGACLAITKPNSISLYRKILRDMLSHDVEKDCEELRALFA